jgi:hypothetical protein
MSMVVTNVAGIFLPEILIQISNALVTLTGTCGVTAFLIRAIAESAILVVDMEAVEAVAVIVVAAVAVAVVLGSVVEEMAEVDSMAAEIKTTITALMVALLVGLDPTIITVVLITAAAAITMIVMINGWAKCHQPICKGNSLRCPLWT